MREVESDSALKHRPTTIGRAVVFSICFVLALLLGDRLIARGLREGTALGNDRFVRLYEGRAAADIVVIGNSRADRHFSRDTLCPDDACSVINYGLGGISTVVAEAVFRDHVEHNGAPKLLIVEPQNLVVDPAKMGDLRMFTPRSTRLQRRLEASDRELYLAGKLFHSFAYNSEMLVRVLASVNRPQSSRLHPGVVSAELLANIEQRTPRAFENFPENEAALVRILEFARGEGIDVAVVSTPFLPAMQGKISNLDAWRTGVRELVGVESWHDFTTSETAREHFNDGYHLNARGARELGARLIDSGLLSHVMRASSRGGDR